jgi:hypothetical protein
MLNTKNICRYIHTLQPQNEAKTWSYLLNNYVHFCFSIFIAFEILDFWFGFSIFSEILFFYSPSTLNLYISDDSEPKTRNRLHESFACILSDCYVFGDFLEKKPGGKSSLKKEWKRMKNVFLGERQKPTRTSVEKRLSNPLIRH